MINDFGFYDFVSGFNDKNKLFTKNDMNNYTF